MYSCVATVIAAAILAAYFSRAWQLNREKLIQMLAIAQGVDLAAIRQQAHEDQEEPSTEQASYSQILEARAVKTRNLELREQSLRAAVAQAQAEQRKLADEKKRLQGLREGFQGDLLATGERRGRQRPGRRPPHAGSHQAQAGQGPAGADARPEGTRRGGGPPGGMTEGKRAKIIAEFKTPAEVDQIGEVLRRIRQGAPAANVAENTEKKHGTLA